MVTEKVSTDTKLFETHEILGTKNRVYQGVILKRCLNWLNLKKRMHWLGRRKEGPL